MPTALRKELTANLYLFLAGQTKASKNGCIVLASYAGQKGCEGFPVPSGMTIGYYPSADPQIDWKERAAEFANLHDSGRAAFVVQTLVLAANVSLGQSKMVWFNAGKTVPNPLLRKYDFAHEPAYRQQNDQIVSVEFYDSLLRAVDDANESTDDKLRGEWNYHVVSVRNRIFHGGVTLRDVIREVQHYVPRVTEWLLPFAAPTLTGFGGG